MTTFQLFIVCVTALLIVVVIGSIVTASAGPSRAQADVFEGLQPGEQVGVHLSDGQSVSGALRSVCASYVELGGAQLVSSGSATSMGIVRVTASAAEVVQRITAG